MAGSLTQSPHIRWCEISGARWSGFEKKAGRERERERGFSLEVDERDNVGERKKKNLSEIK